MSTDDESMETFTGEKILGVLVWGLFTGTLASVLIAISTTWPDVQNVTRYRELMVYVVSEIVLCFLMSLFCGILLPLLGHVAQLLLFGVFLLVPLNAVTRVIAPAATPASKIAVVFTIWICVPVAIGAFVNVVLLRARDISCWTFTVLATVALVATLWSAAITDKDVREIQAAEALGILAFSVTALSAVPPRHLSTHWLRRQREAGPS